MKIKDKMIGPGQPDTTSAPPGPVDFIKQPARPSGFYKAARPTRENILLGQAGPGRAGRPFSSPGQHLVFKSTINSMSLSSLNGSD
jgi:hypothetical protein